MRDPERIPQLLNKLKTLWSHYPDMRLCQLLYLIMSTDNHHEKELFFIEDDRLDSAIQKMIKERNLSQQDEEI